MVNYQNGKIYKLICSETERVYIGSTTLELKKRLNYHKRKENKCVSRYLINPKIELIENYSCNSIKELEIKERFYIENNDCINFQIPGRTKEEYRKVFREKNPNYQNEWYQKNKLKCKISNYNYKNKNPEHIKQIKAKSNLKNNIPITCECGITIQNKYGLNRHKKSKGHLKRI